MPVCPQDLLQKNGEQCTEEVQQMQLKLNDVEKQYSDLERKYMAQSLNLENAEAEIEKTEDFWRTTFNEERGHLLQEIKVRIFGWKESWLFWLGFD